MGKTNLTIDLSAARPKLSPSEVCSWGSGRRVFISSVQEALQEERLAVAKAIRDLCATPVMFEEFGGRDDDPEAAYLSEVAGSTIYIGILGRSYGRLQDSRLSATHTEFREAERQGLRICTYVAEGEDFQGDQRSFVEEVRKFHVTGSYANATSLGSAVRDRLSAIAAEETSPWCKLGQLVFRAHSVVNDGRRFQVEATIYDRGIVQQLVRWRPSLLTSTIKRLTYADSSISVRLEKVRTKVTAKVGTQVSLQLASDTEPCDMGFPAGVRLAVTATYSRDEITDILLRKVLFGEAEPTGILRLGSPIGDPLGGLAAARLPEESVRPILSLLLTEALVGAGRAERVAAVALGARLEGRRLLRVDWQPRATSGQPRPAIRRVEGQTSW
jgi:hypothetical protein